MRLSSIILSLFLLTVWFGGCQNGSSGSQASLAGTSYQGVIPCADCPGIVFSVDLKKDHKYQTSSMYIDESSHKFIEEGTWQVKADTLLVLKDSTQNERLFEITDSQLVMLDADGKRITGSTAHFYVLNKVSRVDTADKWQDKREQGIDFRAAGNEPFWGLDIDFDSTVVFHQIDGDTLRAPVPKMKRDTASPARIFKTEKFQLALSPVGCMDSMSGQVFDYLVQVKTNEKTFKGCGDFINPSARLNDFWALYSLDGKKIDKSQLQFGLPTLHFSTAQQKVYGNTGCNQLSGTFTAEDGSISFSKVVTTKRACMGENLEQPFLEAMNTADSYKIANAELMLLQGSDTLMVFRRAE